MGEESNDSIEGKLDALLGWLESVEHAVCDLDRRLSELASDGSYKRLIKKSIATIKSDLKKVHDRLNQLESSKTATAEIIDE